MKTRRFDMRRFPTKTLEDAYSKRYFYLDPKWKVRAVGSPMKGQTYLSLAGTVEKASHDFSVKWKRLILEEVNE